MKRTLIICLVVMITILTAACSNSGRMSDGSSNQSTNELLEKDNNDTSISDNSDSSEPNMSTDVPEMNAEQQKLYDQYFKPLLYSNFFVGNYHYKTLNAEWGEGGIITIYQDLAGTDVWTKLVDDQNQISASDVEDILMRYFPFDAQIIQLIADSYYDPDTNAYTMVERGGGPREIVITESGHIGNDFLDMYYDLYGPGDDGNLEKVASGRMQVQLLENGQFNYVNNGITYS